MELQKQQRKTKVSLCAQKSKGFPTNKASEYAYNEQVYIKEGFYRGKYGRIDSYNEKTNIYIIRIHITKDDNKEEDMIKIETQPQYIRHIKGIWKFGRH